MIFLLCVPAGEFLVGKLMVVVAGRQLRAVNSYIDTLGYIMVLLYYLASLLGHLKLLYILSKFCHNSCIDMVHPVV